MIAIARVIALALTACSLAGCPSPSPGSQEPKGAPSSPDAEAASERTIDLAALSGREQPQPAEVSVAVGATVVLRVRGLGPPKVVVRSAAGPVATTDGALTEHGSVTGTEARFVASAPGVYDVQDAGGALLAHVTAR